MGKHLTQEDVDSCIVRVDSPKRGVAFFIAPTLMLTCAHVVVDSDAQDDSDFIGCNDIQVSFEKDKKSAILYDIDNELDVALLGITDIGSHPSIYLSTSIAKNDDLTGWGWPEGFEEEQRPTNFKFTGETKRDDGTRRLSLNTDIPIKPGWSGSPLWNPKTGKVCGIVNETYDRKQSEGASGIPAEYIFGFLKDSISKNVDIAKTILASRSLEDLGKFYESVQSDVLKKPERSNDGEQSTYEILRSFLKSIKHRLQFKIDESKTEEIIRKVKKISPDSPYIEEHEFRKLFVKCEMKARMLKFFCKEEYDYSDRLTPEHFVLMLLGLETQNECFSNALPTQLKQDFEKFTYKFTSDCLREIYEIQGQD